MPPSFTNKHYNDRRAFLRKIAEETIKAIEQGTFVLQDVAHDLRTRIEDSKRRTLYFAPDSLLSTWSTKIQPTTTTSMIATNVLPPTEISILEISTLDGARYLATNASQSGKIGVLNFASAKKPGGGFLNGAQAQEESIARSSTLYPTLMLDISQTFYTHHTRDSKGGYYSHAMIYSPDVVVFRNDDGGWVEPFQVDVLTSPAVNAGVVRKMLRRRLGAKPEEERIEKVMKARMGRILFLFEKQGVKNIVLGSFGTGVFQNNVDVVATIWADLLSTPEARFKNSFDRVVFAILGRKTFVEFEDSFRARSAEDMDEDGATKK